MTSILKRLTAAVLPILMAASLIPCGAAWADEPPVPGADAPTSPTGAATRSGLAGFSAVPDDGSGAGSLGAYSLGASRVDFASIISYAERYLGLPYVWGGKDPARDGGFDCSGYAIWVFNHVCGTAVDPDGTNAARLYGLCTPVSRGEAVPGDLVFFRGTYGGLDYISHVGIYCGGGVMIDAGDPIGYDNIDDVRNARGEQAVQLFGRLVDLGRSGIDLASRGVSVRVANQAYTGAAVTPAVTVTSLGTVLREGADYALSFSNNRRAGTATVSVVGRGACAGTSASATFEIYDPPALTGSHGVHLSSSAGMMLDVTGGSTSEGAYLQFYESNGTDAQGFVTERQPSGKYALKNVKSGLYVSADADARTVGNDTRVVQRPWTGEASQLWDVRPLSGGAGGEFAITTALDGTLALDVQNASMRNGARIQLYHFNGGASQRWAFSPFASARESLDALARQNASVLADGVYAVRSAVNGSFVLDCQNGGTDNFTAIQLYGDNATEAQRFRVSHDEAGYVTLTSTKSGRALDVPGGEAATGARIQLYDANGTFAQKWVAVPDGPRVKLVSALNAGMTVDLSAANAVDGGVIQLYPANGTPAQSWAFEKLS